MGIGDIELIVDFFGVGKILNNLLIKKKIIVFSILYLEIKYKIKFLFECHILRSTMIFYIDIMDC